MQVAISTKHGSLSNGEQATISNKAEKLLTYFERVTHIGVTTVFDDGRLRVEILVDAEHKHNFVAHADGEVGNGVIPVFEQALHKMEHQITKYKEKLQDHRRDKPMNELTETKEST